MYKSIVIVLIACINLNLNAQISGNQVYGSNSTYYGGSNNYLNQAIQKRSVSTNDSTLNITVSILLNKVADSYMVTVGVNQEAETALECNKAINTRISNLKKSLLPFEVEEKDVYVDFISQTKIYDYELGDKQAQQFMSGYEIKKNIIIRITDIDYIDQLIELAAKQDIFDIVKVDYVDADIDATYNQLYKEALTLLKSRKKLYLESSDIKLDGSSSIFGDNFYAISPKTQYKKYEAFETSNLTVYRANYSDNYLQKETRKQTTFYYDGIQASGFDKIINGDIPKVGLQYVFSLNMVYGVIRAKG